MKILLTGLNHKTAPVELRERLAISPESLPEATRALLAHPGVDEALILSTCNRVELLISWSGSGSESGSQSGSEPESGSARESAAEPILERFLTGHFSVDSGSLTPHLYHHRDRQAVEHLFRVASSLDSMVVGEAQILGQVRYAYSVSRESGAIGSHRGGPLDKLLQATLSTAKRVRTETAIGASSVSIASVAVDLARRIFGSLDGRRILLVGAGKMSELAARHLMHHGARHLVVVNRTFERAVRLAERFQGKAHPWDDLQTIAPEADILIASTGSATPIIATRHASSFLHRRRNRPMLFIDIGVPRDIDPAINQLDNVFLYDIDDLQSVAASNLSHRNDEAERAEAIIVEEARRFEQRARTIDLAPAIVDLQTAIEDLRQAELRRSRSRLQSLTPEQHSAVEALTRGLMNKFLHLPLTALKAAAREGDTAALETIRHIFQPESKEESSGESREAAPPKSELIPSDPQPSEVKK
ncbi:glutamyl-tRNA reductase [Paracidobacterium acidisoli]|uniref:Glutamyl-tRNA reductase n=1 Tax=Paracidobacterium acidisoli TaxID=2303751 RepID=A0A372IQU6_9BACT|nr:glutamyl-tRNA reductase [Paracidobacterium acidisoli]MBT9330156.1 glutamyl-tRNA reductase [Paracidobacterium acidisoli]